MKQIDFREAQKKAIDYLSRFYNLQKIDPPDGNLTSVSSYGLELEILKDNNTLCLNLIIFLNSDFPLSLPVIYVSKADIPKIGFLPNIDTNGLICVFDSNTNIPNPDSPEKVLDECVRKAKSIIEDGLKSDKLDKYNDEFIAYWENDFETEEKVDTTVLSLIVENGKPPDTVNYVAFSPSIGRFSNILYSKPEQFDRFRTYFKEHKIIFKDIPTFYLGELDIWSPPYHMSNKDALTLIKNRGVEDKFLEYLKSKPMLPIVTFARLIDSTVLIFGWRHKPIEIKTHHRRRKFVQVERPLKSGQFEKLLDPKNASVLTQRFSPQLLNHSRLIRRTSADYNNYETTPAIKVMIAGLGSIGSNLIPFLEKSGIVEYRLVDNDYLSLDNIGRHFLGINDTGRKKTEALRDYLENKNPLTIVQTREKRIIRLIQEEQTFLSDCDFYFFCTGDINAETWLAQNINGSTWCRPSFFIWVEPYLAGGHCLYFNGVDSINWEKIFPNNRFIYNIISDETHQKTSFIKREAGCQVTFLPYSASNLQMFLASLFPKLLSTFGAKGDNKCFSWVGNLSTLKEMKIGISEYGNESESFSLIERQL